MSSFFCFSGRGLNVKFVIELNKGNKIGMITNGMLCIEIIFRIWGNTQ